MMNTLAQFEARQSEDEAKTDLELTCTECEEVLCDIEHGDSLEVLISVVSDHTCDPHDEDGNRVTPDWQEEKSVDSAACYAANEHQITARHSRDECPLEADLKFLRKTNDDEGSTT